MTDSLGDRMKNNYENRNRHYLTRRTPVIIRIDGRAFHTYTRGFDKPFDRKLQCAMEYTMLQLCFEIQGAVLAYTQSDEISILVQDWSTLQTCAWFDYNVAKITSISASIATRVFNKFLLPCRAGKGQKWAEFDSRCFNIPLAEVTNYFLWRAQDCRRNSVSTYAQAHFSHNQLHKKTCADMHEMLHQIGKNWAKGPDLDDWDRNGLFRWKEDEWNETVEIQPNFTDIDTLVKAALPT